MLHIGLKALTARDWSKNLTTSNSERLSSCLFSLYFFVFGNARHALKIDCITALNNEESMTSETIFSF